MKSLDVTEAVILATILDLNQRRCKPPLPDKEVRAIAKSATKSDSKPKASFLKRLQQDVEFWHDENGEPYATISQGDHRENWRIGKKSKTFVRWLSKRWYDSTGNIISANELNDVMSLLEAKAIFDGPEHRVVRRVANYDGAFYLDLCDEPWRAIKIDAEKWCVVSNPPVKFRRAKAMQRLPDPIRSNRITLADLLLPFLNIRGEDWPLVAVWVVAAIRPTGPYPILMLLGEQGSAKTTTARVLRLLVDPNSAPVRAEPRNTRDLMISANNQWILCLDNLSSIKSDLSDALCRLSTGGGFATRSLYSDDEETIFEAMRPVILTSIAESCTRSDLLERSLVIELPRIEHDRRRPEKRFWEAFKEVHPQILAKLLDVVSGAIRELPNIERDPDTELPRLADFHHWGEASEMSLGLKNGSFANAFTSNRATVTQIVLEASPLISALLKLMKKKRQIEMTTAALLEKLCFETPDLTKQPGWPRTPRILSSILRRVAPDLRQTGFTVEQVSKGSGDAKRKVWRITGPYDPATHKKAVKASWKKKAIKKKTRSNSAETLSEAIERNRGNID
jgi:ABC-type oligopeptide transport system ATPase subunit